MKREYIDREAVKKTIKDKPDMTNDEKATLFRRINAIPAADVVERPRWIPVTERLPKAYEDVLLLFPHNQAAGFCDRDGCWGVYSGDGFYTEVAENEPKPTHWTRKLPKPPKEEA